MDRRSSEILDEWLAPVVDFGCGYDGGLTKEIAI